MKTSSSKLRSAINELSLFAVMKHELPVKPFLSLCNFLIYLLDKIGPTMVVLREDVNRNMQRLEKMQESDPELYSNVLEMLKKEANDGSSRNVTSASKAFLWLTRSLDFTVNLMEFIEKDTSVDMEQAVEGAYELTLKPWHGWISSTAYRVARKLVPDNKTMIQILLSETKDEETLKHDLQAFTSLLIPILHEIHSILETYGLDRLKAT